jgi:putative tricarboxylic transport membrane protein
MRRQISRRDAFKLVAVGVAAAAFAGPGEARAQSFPERPINVVVPFDTGGYNDRLARAFAPFLQKELGQPVVIVNRPGAGALLGHTYFLQQPDDGYTILSTSAAPYIPLNILLQDAPFSVDDFQVINLPSHDFTLMATAADSDIESAEEFFTKLKEDPSAYSIGVQPASADFANLILTIDKLGIDRDALRLVTYDGGGPTRNAAAGGVVDVSFVGGQGFLPLKDKIKPLLAYSEEPTEEFPETPTIVDLAKSQGFEPEFVAGSQRGWAVHSALKEKHPDRYETLVNAIEAASKNPEAIKALQDAQLATRWYGPEASQQALERTFETMQKHVDLLQGS